MLTNFGEKFARNCLKKFFEVAIAPDITNQDYVGEIKGGGGDRLNIITFGDIAIGDYNVGTDMILQRPKDTEEQLIVNQKKYYYFDIDDLDKWMSYVDDEQSSLIENAGSRLAEVVDAFILGNYTEVKAGSRIGVDEVAGTVAVTASTGAVVGATTVFNAMMVGKGFYVGTTWYKITAVASATSITVKNWDDTLPLSGGDVAPGASFRVEADDAIQVTASNIYANILELKKRLDKNKIPKTDRCLVVDSDIGNLILRAPELIPAVSAAYEEVVLKGLLGTISGFKVYQNEQIYTIIGGDTIVGKCILALHKTFITMAMAFTETGVEDVPKQFCKAYKGLNVYGAKVLTERRKAGALLFCKL